ncbi:mitochondrial assembly of ribosomal large subunit protein 1 [Pygocentrus nattereri]|uniref:Mitochondrial assembly of ribosomal large subunit protein 1 n=1 Tax=Pygocentrus nattereri TaxID=42514 RepID=A0A3B4CYY7_PYGNA|nr:mitochondrial assembly of ribosomal large subunit protein 1 [Pygocentrus nattereri]
MNALRRSPRVLSQLCGGAACRVRAAHRREEQRRTLRPEAPFTGFTHSDSKVCGLTAFKELHSQTSTTSGGGADGGTYSRGQTAHLRRQQQQGGSVVFNLDVMVSLLRQENAEDICVIQVPEELKYTEYFIVVSGSSARHLRAMALYAIKVYKFMKKECDPHVHIEGKDAEDWMCIDFGCMVVHFMLPETRATYELEKLWTLRSYDEQLNSIPIQSLPTDFIYDAETK